MLHGHTGFILLITLLIMMMSVFPPNSRTTSRTMVQRFDGHQTRSTFLLDCWLFLSSYSLPDVEFVGRVGEALEFPQGFELFPPFDDALQQSSIPLLLQVSELASVSEETSDETDFQHFNNEI